MGLPQGNLVTPVVPNSSGDLRTPEVDASDRWRVVDEGGTKTPQAPAAERKSNLSAAAGFNSLTATAVPSGKRWIVRSICAWDNDSAITSVNIVATIGGVSVWLNSVRPTGAKHPATYHGLLVLTAADTLGAEYWGCTLNDDIYLDIAYEEYTV